jgi:6-methylsalicylate decarboxylase
MDELNIIKSIVSISSPGTHLDVKDDAHAAKLARNCNTFSAELKREHPDRFGFFASLPLPAIDESLAEIDHALSEGADGFVVMTNAHGHYLGDELFNPVFDKMNECKATVFIHPTWPCTVCKDTVTATPSTQAATPLASKYRIPMFEFLFDTARAIINLFLSGTVSRCPDIKFIFPHGSGAFPPLFSRISSYSQFVPGGRKTSEAEVRTALLKQCYFDLAGWVFAEEPEAKGQLIALMEGIGVTYDRLLFGTDYCFTQAPYAKWFTEVIDKKTHEMFDMDQAAAILSGNAIKLFEKSE